MNGKRRISDYQYGSRVSKKKLSTVQISQLAVHNIKKSRMVKTSGFRVLQIYALA